MATPLVCNGLYLGSLLMIKTLQLKRRHGGTGSCILLTLQYNQIPSTMRLKSMVARGKLILLRSHLRFA